MTLLEVARTCQCELALCLCPAPLCPRLLALLIVFWPTIWIIMTSNCQLICMLHSGDWLPAAKDYQALHANGLNGAPYGLTLQAIATRLIIDRRRHWMFQQNVCNFKRDDWISNNTKYFIYSGFPKRFTYFFKSLNTLSAQLILYCNNTSMADESLSWRRSRFVQFVLFMLKFIAYTDWEISSEIFTYLYYYRHHYQSTYWIS